MAAPFHRLLAYYSNRNSSDTQTIRLQDSLRGNLALGLDFPFALGIAIGRHLTLRNTGLFSLSIHVPTVSWKETPLHGLPIDEKHAYTRSEIWSLARRENGLFAALDAFGLWSLASDVHTGLLSGEDVVGFQQGSLFERLEKRRKDRGQVLPLWRGGPISVAGHSWVVGRVFGLGFMRWGLRGGGIERCGVSTCGWAKDTKVRRMGLVGCLPSRWLCLAKEVPVGSWLHVLVGVLGWLGDVHEPQQSS